MRVGGSVYSLDRSWLMGGTLSLSGPLQPVVMRLWATKEPSAQSERTPN